MSYLSNFTDEAKRIQARERPRLSRCVPRFTFGFGNGIVYETKPGSYWGWTVRKAPGRNH